MSIGEKIENLQLQIELEKEKSEKAMEDLRLQSAKRLQSLYADIAGVYAELSGLPKGTSFDAPKKRGRPKGSVNMKRGPGRPKGSTNATSTSANTNTTPSGDGVRRKRGRPKGSGKKVAAPLPVSDMSLTDAILKVLSNSDDWSFYIADLPKDAEGLQSSEIKEIIEKENLWHSDSPNSSTLIRDELSELKEKGLIVRAADRRYCLEKA